MRGLGLSALRGRRADAALSTLLDVYHRRTDLIEAFPEAHAGDHGRLIRWAAGASTGKWSDPSGGTLAPHARWYGAEAASALAPPIDYDWDAIGEASRRSALPLRATIEAMREQPSDIGHHLPMLALLVVELRLRSVVELGVREGISSVALLEAAAAVDGRVLSVDVEPCEGAAARVAHAGLDGRWEFIQGSDLDVPDERIPDPIDLLFIDTTHLYEHTLAELAKYSPRLRPGSWIALHDYTACAGVRRAADEFVASLPQGPRFYPFVHQNGLALLHL